MFQSGERLSRAVICERLGIARDEHAVIVNRGAVLAIIVNKSGKNPFNGKQYANAHGTFPPFFRQNSEPDYAYEGRVRFVNRLDVPKEPVRVFERIEPGTGSSPSGR